ncbi:STAS domain-containing protein [Amycolatopsis sp. NPDC051045]|uniref:STAS domain-containing protein n=1 Tax=Amycolatopsis sp. NPDC051045 TaxID=3156922 RepID=UPI0034324AEA
MSAATAAGTAAPVRHSASIPAPRSQVDALLRLTLSRPAPATAVITVDGELDLLTAPRLAELLTARLTTAVRTLVVDLSKVAFLGCAGIGVLARAQCHAQATGRELRVVTGSDHVDRILRLTGLHEDWRCYPELIAALAEDHSRRR